MIKRRLLFTIAICAFTLLACDQPNNPPAVNAPPATTPPASLSRMYRINFKDASDVLVGYQILSYDSEGNLTKIDDYNASDSKTATTNYSCANGKITSYGDSTRKTEFFYNAEGRIIKTENRKLSDNSLVKTSNYSYNALGQISKIETFNGSGSAEDVFEYTYTDGFRTGMTVKDNTGATIASEVFLGDSSKRLIQGNITYGGSLYRKNYYLWEDQPTTIDIHPFILG